MIRTEFVAHIAERNPHLFARDVTAVVGIILDTMIEALVRGDRVELRGFGVFEPERRAPRLRRDPRAQIAVEVPEDTAVGFKPSAVMRARLDPIAQD